MPLIGGGHNFMSKSFSGQIFTRQFSWQKFIEIYQNNIHKGMALCQFALLGSKGFTELSRSVWENRSWPWLYEETSLHSVLVRVLMTLVNILPYRPAVRLIRAK